jgi:exopolysaccharide biosynthesis polyprenyl glycosylphosphotransferase
MINNRLRGLLNLHIGATLMLALLLLMAHQNVYQYLPVQEILPSVNFFPFIFCVAAGMSISSRYLQVQATRFHRMSWVDSAALSTRQTVAVALFVFAFMFAFKNREMSRLFLGSYLTMLWSMLLFANVGLPRTLCRLFFQSDRRVPTLFIGSQRSLVRLKHWLASREMLGLHPVGFLSDGDLAAGDTSPSFLGGVNLLPKILSDRQVVQVIVLELPDTGEGAQFIIETCQTYGCRLLIHSNLSEQLNHPLITVTEEGHQFHTLQEEPLEDPMNRILKRGLDIAISLPVVLLLLPPLVAWVWVLQRVQAPGRLFFRQQRTGHGQHCFQIIKFRSMYEASQSPTTEARQARRGDDRIYPFGRFLRASSFDEFPQFINVLKGEMSVVGPRPHLVAHDREFSRNLKGYRTRFFVKPGITGLAQCNGLRGEITEPKLLEERIKLDVDYITRWSIWLDLQITVKTAWQMVRPPKSAY